MKARNLKLTWMELTSRASASEAKGYAKQKWIAFCETMIDNGLTCYLYEAQKTFSKYITVTDGKRQFKVRFSNHKPINSRELSGDCDFFVGVTNTGVRTTGDAILKTLEFFGKVNA